MYLVLLDFGHEINLKGLIHLVLLDGKPFEIFYFPSAFVILAKSFEKKFLRSFISKDAFPVIAS